MGTFKAKVSQPGFDVQNTSNINLSVNADLNNYRIEKVMQVEVPFPSGSIDDSFRQISVPHGLDYIPAWKATVFTDSPTYPDLMEVPIDAGWANLYLEAYVDATNITCYATVFGTYTGTTITFNVILFAIDLENL